MKQDRQICYISSCKTILDHFSPGENIEGDTLVSTWNSISEDLRAFSLYAAWEALREGMGGSLGQDTGQISLYTLIKYCP